MAPWRRWTWAIACLVTVACGERRPTSAAGTHRFGELPRRDAGTDTPGESPDAAPVADSMSEPADRTAPLPTSRELGPDVPVAPLASRDPQRDLTELVAVIEHVKRAPDLEAIVSYLGERGDSLSPAWTEIRTTSPRIVAARARTDGTSLVVELELFESIPGALVERELGAFEPAYVLGEFEDAVVVFRRALPAPRRWTLIVTVEADRAALADASVHRFSLTRLARSR